MGVGGLPKNSIRSKEEGGAGEGKEKREEERNPLSAGAGSATGQNRNIESCEGFRWTVSSSQNTISAEQENQATSNK